MKINRSRSRENLIELHDIDPDYLKHSYQTDSDENDSCSPTSSLRETNTAAKSKPQNGGLIQKEVKHGKYHTIHVVANIFISFVGSGLLGMPYAFSQSGWILGTIALVFVSSLNIYTMLLLVKIRHKLERDLNVYISGYGDIGKVLLGGRGEKFVNTCIVISQIGFATAYIIFISANLLNIYDIDRFYTCFACIPVLAILIQLQEMKYLAPFSLLADIANVSGLVAVMIQDYKSYSSTTVIVPYNFNNLLYVASVSLYALEGVAMVIPLEISCGDKKLFPSLLKKTLFGVTTLMAVFGTCGYFAFGSETLAPVTLNLDGRWAIIVILLLCLGLYLTFPIMMFPVNDVMEDIFLPSSCAKPNILFRIFVVFLSCSVAYLVPDFGKFLSLVGASLCTILGFILPSFFHLNTFSKAELTWWEYAMDWFLIGFGVLFGIMGTYDAIVSFTEEN